MITPQKLQNLLKVARDFRVSKVIFTDGEVSEVEFFPYSDSPTQATDTQPKEFHKQEVEELRTLQEQGMPSDEELRYLSTDFVPAHMLENEAPIAS